jgi:hypothetical protein
VKQRSPAEQLEKLKEKWYAKLKREGFEDIERSDGSLTKYSQNAYRDRREADNDTWVAAKTDYYRMAEHFLNEHKFENNTERFIWQLHSEGVSARKISTRLKSRNVKKPKTQVHEIIQKIAAKMFEQYGVTDGSG